MPTEKQPSTERRVRSKADGDHEDLFESSTETGIKVYVKLELPAVDRALLEGTKQDGKRAATDDPPGSRAPKKQKKAPEQGSTEKKKGGSSIESSDQESKKESGNEQRSPYPHFRGVELPDLPWRLSEDEKRAAVRAIFDIVAEIAFAK